MNYVSEKCVEKLKHNFTMCKNCLESSLHYSFCIPLAQQEEKYKESFSIKNLR